MRRAVDFRRSAREALKGRWGLAVAACLVASILGGVSSSIFNVDFSFVFDISEQNADQVDTSLENIFNSISEEAVGIILIVASVALVIGLAVSALYFVLGSTVSLGYSKFNLALVDNREATINNLFQYFGVWKNAALTQLLRVVYTVLWSLLLIIPGIIASYSYAMTPYILAEFPEISPKEAIEASKKLMYGNRYRLFCLEISFIGWHLLCGLSFGVGYLWLNPYINAAKADFYREISGTRPKIDIPLEDFFETSDGTTE